MPAHGCYSDHETSGAECIAADHNREGGLSRCRSEAPFPVVIPRPVAAEINAGPADDAAVRFLAQPLWLSVIDLAPALSPPGNWHLGQGESEVLEYARRNLGTVAVLDDKAGSTDGTRPWCATRRNFGSHRCCGTGEIDSVPSRRYSGGSGRRTVRGSRNRFPSS